MAFAVNVWCCHTHEVWKKVEWMWLRLETACAVTISLLAESHSNFSHPYSLPGIITVPFDSLLLLLHYFRRIKLNLLCNVD